MPGMTQRCQQMDSICFRYELPSYHVPRRGPIPMVILVLESPRVRPSTCCPSPWQWSLMALSFPLLSRPSVDCCILPGAAVADSMVG
jgi:hypothetical protein